MSARYHSKLRIPEAPFRPRENPDYSFLHLPSPEDVAKPDCMADADTIRQLAFSMVRVLDDDQNAKGAWDPQLPVSELLEGLRIMTLTRLYDDRLFRMQRQGKLSFYVKCTGEEAIAVAQAMALHEERARS